MIYRRLENNVRFNPFVRDEDSKSYKTVPENKPRGEDYVIQKEQCIRHIQKSMDTRLRKVDKNSKVKSVLHYNHVGT